MFPTSDFINLGYLLIKGILINTCLWEINTNLWYSTVIFKREYFVKQVHVGGYPVLVFRVAT